MTPQQIINEVKSIVGPVYLVGGSVRDMLLGREPKDYDFTTPLTPDEVEEKVKAAGRHVYAIGKKFGTIGFKVMDGKTPYYVEVTTYRSEQYKPGNRKPEVVFVDDLKEDLSRRDFTINAIAYDGEQYIDPFGGRLDILARKIKAVGKAKDRFREDPLRMLRAARFSAQLGFDIDPNMIGFIRASARTIYTVSRERWVQEMDKLLLSEQPGRGLDALADSYLLRYMLPEVFVAHYDKRYSVVYPMYGSVPFNEFIAEQLVKQDKDADIRWALLLANIGMPYAENLKNDTAVKQISNELAAGIAARLKFSNKRTEVVANTVFTGVKY